MNAVLQCLSNTDLFAEYFVADFYRIDRKKHRKINHSCSGGSRGEVSESLALLLKALWGSASNVSEAANKFKATVCRSATQYQGASQHDALEFLLWLLDAAHEELNLSSRKQEASQRVSHALPVCLD